MLKTIPFCALILFGLNGFAQNIHGNAQVWFFNLSEYRINDQWNIANEVHLRFDEFTQKRHQLILRPYVDYNFNDKLVGSFGYSYLETYPYGDFPLKRMRPEHNIWEQITIKNKLGKWTIAHRYRIEHRWSGQIVTNENDVTKIDGYGFSNRFRYRLTVKRDLGKAFYTHIFDELWIRENNTFKSITFDRNWVYAGLGWKTTDFLSLELAYLHQYAQNTPSLFERHHSVQMTLKLSL